MIAQVVGVSFKNEELGVDRQDIIRKLCGHEDIILEREPNNRHDKYAVAVYVSRGLEDKAKIGYLKSELAYVISSFWKEFKFNTKIYEIREGDVILGKPWGVTISIVKAKGGR